MSLYNFSIHSTFYFFFFFRYKLHKTRCLTVTMQNLTEVPNDVFESANAENVNIVDFSRNRFTSLPEG